jgi:hypothetical protein
MNGGDKIKILGPCWHPTLNKFTFANIEKLVALMEDVSKCKVGAVVASIFDPVGLLSPSFIPYKIFLQELWLHKLRWADTLPTELWGKMAATLQAT